ncbi:MAG: arginine--tRNA ligase [Candidatus Woesearchaeota archaeon]
MEEEIKKALKKILKKDVELEIPPDSSLGDYAFPCFPLAKEFKKNPNDIAIELSEKIKGDFRVEAKGAYLNFFVDKVKRSKTILGKIFLEKSRYGVVSKKGKKVLVESPGPNTNKPLHLGHLRNIFLGVSVKNILSALGNKVVMVDIVNDRGVHISKSMLAYKLYGKNKKPDMKSDHFVGEYYVIYNKKANEEMEKKAQELLVKWEKGDKETVSLWKEMNKWALDGFNETYKNVGFKVDKVYYESEHYKEGKKLVLDGLKKGIFKKNEKGAVVIDLSKEGLGDKVLLREDGTSVYVTQDISLAIKRYKDFKMDSMVYVVGNEQIYHFNVLFKILEILGYKFAKNCYHLVYGMVNLPEGKMKSREGKVVDADDLISGMIDLAMKETKKRYEKISKKELLKRGRIIGLGALRFYILKYDPLKDILFNPEESISFEGDTGPYVQYAHVRCSSILGHGKLSGKIDYKLFNEYDHELVKVLSEFSGIVEKAGMDYKPSLVANYLLELAKKFNEFYSRNPVLKAKCALKNSRLKLVYCTRQVLKNGLSLLGIDAPDEM